MYNDTVVFELLKLIYFYFIDLIVNITIVESVLLAAFSIYYSHIIYIYFKYFICKIQLFLFIGDIESRSPRKICVPILPRNLPRSI